MTKLQVYRTDQMNVGPVDPEVFPRMANQRDFYLKSDVDALLATLQQPEPPAELPINKMVVGPYQDLELQTDNGRVLVNNGSPHLVEVIARCAPGAPQKYQSTPGIIDGPCIHCGQPFRAHWQDENTYAYMCAVNRTRD